MSIYAQRLATNVNVGPALAEIQANQILWGADPERTVMPNSPHAQAPDIWLRCRPRREIHNKADFGEPHFPEFYPAWERLPALHEIVFGVMRLCSATSLGFTMLSLIPAGKEVRPHLDSGWHSNHFDRKVYVILKANDRCPNTFPDGSVIMRPGEAWAFENRVTHSVQNNGDDDRIALIITMRTE